MSMPKTYLTHEDVTVPIIGVGAEPMKSGRVQGCEVCLDHSEADLMMHRRAGIVAVVILVLMTVAVVGVVFS